MDDTHAVSTAAAATPGLGRRAAAGAAWITIETVCSQGIALVVFSVLAHFLGPRDFGLVSISFVFLYSTKFILLDQICAAIMRKAQGSDLEYTTAFWLTVGASLAAFGALEAFSFAADLVFHAPGLGNVMRAMGLILLVMGCARAQESWLMRHFMFRTLALRSITGVVLGGIVGVTCATQGFGVWALVSQQIVTSVAGFTLLCFTCPWRPTLAFSKATAREIGHFLRGAGTGNAINVMNDNGDTLLIALAYGPASAGVYAVGKRLLLALQLVAATPVNGVAMPMLAEVQTDPARLRRVLLTAIGLVMTTCGAMFMGTAAVGHEAVGLLFGTKWSASAPVVAWLAISGLCTLLARFNNITLMIRGHAMWTMYLAGLYTTFALLCFVALRATGSHNLALPFVLPWAVVLPISIAMLLRVTGLRLAAWSRAIAPPVAAAAAMFIGVRMAAPYLAAYSVSVRLALMVALGAAIYAAVLAPLNRHVIADALQMLRARRRAA